MWIALLVGSARAETVLDSWLMKNTGDYPIEARVEAVSDPNATPQTRSIICNALLKPGDSALCQIPVVKGRHVFFSRARVGVAGPTQDISDYQYPWCNIHQPTCLVAHSGDKPLVKDYGANGATVVDVHALTEQLRTFALTLGDPNSPIAWSNRFSVLGVFVVVDNDGRSETYRPTLNARDTVDPNFHGTSGASYNGIASQSIAAGASASPITGAFQANQVAEETCTTDVDRVMLYTTSSEAWASLTKADRAAIQDASSKGAHVYWSESADAVQAKCSSRFLKEDDTSFDVDFVIGDATFSYENAQTRTETWHLDASIVNTHRREVLVRDAALVEAPVVVDGAPTGP